MLVDFDAGVDAVEVGGVMIAKATTTDGVVHLPPPVLGGVNLEEDELGPKLVVAIFVVVDVDAVALADLPSIVWVPPVHDEEGGQDFVADFLEVDGPVLVEYVGSKHLLGLELGEWLRALGHPVSPVFVLRQSLQEIVHHRVLGSTFLLSLVDGRHPVDRSRTAWRT